MHAKRQTTYGLGLAIVVAASLTAGLVLPDDAAAWWGKKKSRQAESRETPRFDRYPTMEFVSGKLRSDGPAGWRIGNCRLALHGTCRVEDEEGRSGVRSLRDGTPAVVMGNRVGGTMIAFHVIVRKPEWGTFGTFGSVDDPRGEVNIIWSTSDPSVGRGDAPK
jgi:hypothetical protein